MTPDSNPDSGRAAPAIRTVIAVCAAGLIGAAVGGLSVLGVVLAVTVPPNHDVHAAAIKHTGTAAPDESIADTIPRTVPAAQTPLPGNAPAPSVAAAPNPSAAVSAPAAQVVTPAQASTTTVPSQAQTTPAQAQATPAQGAPTTWPDALSSRAVHSTDTASEPPQTAVPTTPVKDETATDRKDSGKVATDAPRRSSRDRLASRPRKTDYAKKHTYVTSQPRQPPADESADEAPVNEPRSLFDFFGGRRPPNPPPEQEQSGHWGGGLFGHDNRHDEDGD
jgi:hypothetical protein